MEHCLVMPFALRLIVLSILALPRYSILALPRYSVIVSSLFAQPSRSLVTFPYCLSCIASLFVILTHGGYVACSYSI